MYVPDAKEQALTAGYRRAGRKPADRISEMESLSEDAEARLRSDEMLSGTVDMELCRLILRTDNI